MTEFKGKPTHVLGNDHFQLEILQQAARIVRLKPFGKENVFVEMNREPKETGYGKFHFYGGHRLWHSPEQMPRTYIPDNEGAVVSEIENGLRIEMPTEPWTNIAKTIEIEVDPQQPIVHLRHELTNRGAWMVKFAPWALTMFKQGGLAIFPQPQGNVDESGLLANRNFSLWPYSSIADPRVIYRDDFILVNAVPALPPYKIGYFAPQGWIAYWVDGVLFVKRFDVNPDGRYPDNGCNVESYCNNEFIELETLGELQKVQAGQTIYHKETWELYETLDVPYLTDEIKQIILSLSK